MGRSPTAEHELLSRLGLSDGASEDEVETAHNDLVAFLEGAPSELHAWARSQVAAADEAYALLSDRAAAINERPAPAPVAPPAKAIRAAAPTRRVKTRAMQVPVEQARAPFLRRIGPLGRIAIAITALAGVLVGGYVVYASDLPSVPGLTGTFTPEGQQPTVDSARVAELMQIIQANPNDIAALQELGDIYYSADEYGTAAQWEQKILDIDPANITAHLAMGVDLYNLGNSADAESHWRRVVELNPSDVLALADAHYYLGFMYFTASPPDTERATAEWQSVIEIAPDSDIAKTVLAHMPQIQGSPSASPGGSASPSGSAATPSPAASPRPSASAGQ